MDLEIIRFKKKKSPSVCFSFKMGYDVSSMSLCDTVNCNFIIRALNQNPGRSVALVGTFCQRTTYFQVGNHSRPQHKTLYSSSVYTDTKNSLSVLDRHGYLDFPSLCNQDNNVCLLPRV